ncbi:hypothetical protein ACQKPX_21310 [Photobacterium sp. DNB23_23_1]|uniref:Uncharacterized protein n=1 Tax=Photobacterium pectinilyticum TaxID=2906793 RepID=A0ABT1N419_9GAMM|nr:hypothetical protein [Photobacterium sp. ZSDE20]MCQ1059490.1 hypothetical protein [Photobacterium sp. ZSDE20]MDD1825305.1 hypothetical protein [Photobacterium sp. ZSDE20]
MKIAVLSLGALLQFFALYIAFYSGFAGGIYLATLISVAAMASMLVVRHLVAPVCLMAGVLIGLSLSHNEADLKMLSLFESQALALLQLDSRASLQYNETSTEITQLDVTPINSDLPDKKDPTLAVVAAK